MISASLRARFAVTFAVSIMVGSGILSFAIGQRSTGEVKREIGRSLSEVAEQIADKLDRGMWARYGEISLLATVTSLNGVHNLQAVRGSLDHLKRAIPLFDWIGFTDPHGKVLASTDGILTGADISHRPVYAEGVKGTFIGDVHEAVMLAKLLPNPTGEPMKFVDISTPVADADGNLAGVLAAHLSWAWAREIEQSVLTPRDDGAAIEVFVVSSDDTVLLGPEGSLGHPLKLAALAKARGNPPGWTVERWPDGKNYLTGHAFGEGHKTFKGLGWTVLARQPLSAAYAPVNALRRDIMLWGAGVAVLFACFGWVVAGHVSAPLRRIAVAADRLRAGEVVDIPAHRGILDIEMLTASLQALIVSLTRSEAARDHAENQANHDRLTGLPNRLALETFLEQAVPAARRSGTALAVLCMDLDGFKAVNDTLGHQAGDELLREVAVRIRGCARAGDLAARLGGDEFVMVIGAPADQAEADARIVGQRVIEALAVPILLDGHEARIGCSIGAAIWPAHAGGIHEVIRLADEALYVSKRGGKNRVSLHAG